MSNTKHIRESRSKKRARQGKTAVGTALGVGATILAVVPLAHAGQYHDVYPIAHQQVGLNDLSRSDEMPHNPESDFATWGSQGVVTTGTASTTNYRRLPDGRVVWRGD